MPTAERTGFNEVETGAVSALDVQTLPIAEKPGTAEEQTDDQRKSTDDAEKRGKTAIGRLGRKYRPG